MMLAPGNGLVLNRWQAINWSSDDLVQWCMYSSSWGQITHCIGKYGDIANLCWIRSILLSLLISNLWALTNKIVRDIPDFTILNVLIFLPQHNTIGCKAIHQKTCQCQLNLKCKIEVENPATAYVVWVAILQGIVRCVFDIDQYVF